MLRLLPARDPLAEYVEDLEDRVAAWKREDEHPWLLEIHQEGDPGEWLTPDDCGIAREPHSVAGEHRTVEDALDAMAAAMPTIVDYCDAISVRVRHRHSAGPVAQLDAAVYELLRDSLGGRA